MRPYLSSPRQKGFTIVELLVVIVVIGILGALVIVAYNGISQRAIEASLASDLKSSSSVLENDKTTNNAYPATAGAAGGGQGLKVSGSNTLNYYLRPYGYCLVGDNPGLNSPRRVKSSTKIVEAGTCNVPVTNYAGGSSGFANGPIASAQFASPQGIAIDSEGNFYIGDRVNNRIRKIDTTGTVSTLSGTGTAGTTNSTGALSQFSGPQQVAVDSAGYVYVADTGNHRIRKVAPNGDTTTLAGSTQGFNNATGTSAQFNTPRGITVDSSGNVYVGDTFNHRIRKITPSGVVTTFAGSTQGSTNGTGTAAQFYNPMGLVVDASGYLYVADEGNNRIRKITPSAEVTTFAGSTDGFADGVGTAAQFSVPTAVTIDGFGGVYVSDAGTVRGITSNGTVATLAGNWLNYGYVNADGVNAQFTENYGIAFDVRTGALFVVDQWNNKIRKVDI